ncbi:hypothetical protein TNCV_4099361 [Trichonephila clavipes]|nr:hypothetical protein TNCV_4099361 [Trichonephila clavipes]
MISLQYSPTSETVDRRTNEIFVMQPLTVGKLHFTLEQDVVREVKKRPSLPGESRKESVGKHRRERLWLPLSQIPYSEPIF